jgi:hypothetical protein
MRNPFIHVRFETKALQNGRGQRDLICGNVSKPQKFVIPAKAGIQPFVFSRTWNGLDPGLRRDDRLLEVAMPLPAISQ